LNSAPGAFIRQLARTLAVLSANEDFDITEFEKEAKPVQQ
jgi:hypothetical protein